MLRKLSTAALIWAAFSCSSEKSEEAEPRDPSPTETSSGHQVLLTTSHGEIIIELEPDKAPISVANFLKYVDQGHYDSTIFHRVIDGYLIEAGRVRSEGRTWVESPANDPIVSESANGLHNDRGSVAMARTARPDSATSAFFINLGDNIALNHPQPDGTGYAVFGKVISGMGVADKIGRVETGVTSLTLLHPASGKPEAREVAEVPTEPVTILSARRIPN